MGFNSIAKYYDGLARLVFGKSLANAQINYLDRIPPASNVLVVGGGTGWWVNDFLKSNPTCKVCYVEESSEMIRLAIKATTNDHRITFKLGKHDSICPDNEFDVVILFCFLDLFSDEQLYEVVCRIEMSMKSNALWLVTDFVETRRWHTILLFIMYRFFRWTTGIENQKLPAWHNSLRKAQLINVEEKFFGRGFIKSALYTKVIV